MGLAGIAILGFMKLSEQSSQTAQSQVLSNDFNIEASNISLAVNSDCVNTLKGLTFNHSQPTPAPIASLTFPNGTVVAAVGYPIVGTRITSLSINQIIGGDIFTIGRLHEVLVNLNVQAQKFTTTSASPTAGTLLPGTQSYSKDFKIVVWYDDQANEIIDCQRPQTMAINFLAPTQTCYQVGTQLQLSWNTTGSEGIAFSGPGLAASLNVPSPLPCPLPQPIYEGTLPVTPQSPGPNTYIATAYGNSGQAMPSPVTITASPSCPPCTQVGMPTFTIQPNSGFNAGDTLTANWSVSNATSVSIQPSPGPVAVSGPTNLSAPPVTTTYTLTATNSCGTSAPVYLTVTPATGCTCGSATVCTGGQTTYSDSCGHQNCNCPPQSCQPPMPTCHTGSATCLGSTWYCQ